MHMDQQQHSSNRGAALAFQGVTAAAKRIASYRCSDGTRLELLRHPVRVRAKGSEMVWRAETNKGPRWLSFEDGKWSISKAAPPRRDSQHPRAA